MVFILHPNNLLQKHLCMCVCVWGGGGGGGGGLGFSMEAHKTMFSAIIGWQLGVSAIFCYFLAGPWLNIGAGSRMGTGGGGGGGGGEPPPPPQFFCFYF